MSVRLPAALFFYGVLRPELASGRMAELVARLAGAEPGSVPGRLYAILDARGHYPVIVDGEAGERVHGAIMRLGPDFDRDALAELDAFEGYDPGNPGRSDYVRRRFAATASDGTGITVDAYAWNRAIAPGFVAIPHGDFARYLAESGASALPG